MQRALVAVVLHAPSVLEAEARRTYQASLAQRPPVEIESELVRAELAIELARSGRNAEAVELLEELGPSATAEAMDKATRVAFGIAPPRLGETQPSRGEVRTLLGTTWSAQVLSAALAEALGDAITAEQIRGQMLQASRQRLLWVLSSELLMIAAVVIGLGALMWLRPWRASFGSWRAPLLSPQQGRQLIFAFVLSCGGWAVLDFGLALAMADVSEVCRLLTWFLLPLAVISIWLLPRWTRERWLPWLSRLPAPSAGTRASLAVGALALYLGGERFLGAVASGLGWEAAPGPEFMGAVVYASLPQLLILAVSVVALGPIVEELLFRGMLYGGLRAWLSAPWSILVSAGAFTAAHLGGVVGPHGYFWGALVLALLFEVSRHLRLCILVHALANGLWLLAAISWWR